jgi:DNA repair exonuclease SbcCD ATPase subunit
MKLISLKLKNFKGVRDFTLDVRGADVSIYGDNATGKTTLFDSFLWLLFGKDSQNRADFDIKTLDDSGQALHGLDHSVEATVELDGRPMTLCKVYSEKWTKKRGAATKEFTGHTTDHFLDGVPVKKGEFDAAVVDIINEDAFKLLTNPRHFNDMLHWQKRREILLEVCGDVSDADVISSDKALGDLPGILGNRSLDDHRKVIAARRTELNREINKIPVRIDEVSQGLPVVTGINRAAIEKEIKALSRALQEKLQERTRIESGGEIAEKQKALRELEAELLDMQNKLRAGIGDKIGAARADRNKIAGEIDSLNSAIRSNEHAITDNQREIERLEARMASLRTNWEQVNSKTFEFVQDEICPTCGQALPVEQLDAAREKALSDFNLSKAKKLEEITAQGRDDRARAGELALQNARMEQENQTGKEALQRLQQEADLLQRRMEELAAQEADVMDDPAFLEKAEGLEVLVDAIAALKEDNREALAAIDAEIAGVEGQIDAAKSKLSLLSAYEAGQARIEELKEQERELAAEYERLEGELYLTEQFVRAKVKLLEEKINSRFEHARFKLFNVLVNGAVEEVCETLYQGVPYSSALNNAAQINVGLDIINTLSEHYGFEPPIWIDNREAVTRLIPTRAQLISLIVSEQDKKLRVELEAQNKTERKKEAV